MEQIIYDYIDIGILRKLFITKRHEDQNETIIKQYLISKYDVNNKIFEKFINDTNYDYIYEICKK